VASQLVPPDSTSDQMTARAPLWLPYAEVERIDDATEHARRPGAAVLLEPREGPC
jgi:hypothetical protein